MSIGQTLPTFHLRLPADLPPSGSLSRFPAYTVLRWAAQQQFTGRIVFDREDRIKYIYLRSGALISSRSNLVSEGLDMILRRGFLTPEQILSIQNFNAPTARDEDWDQRMIRSLNDKKLLRIREIEKVLELQLRERVINLLGWFSGQFKLERDTPPPDQFTVVASIPLHSILDQLEKFLLFGKKMGLSAAVTDVSSPKGDLRTYGGGTVLASFAERECTGKLLFERGQRRKLFEWSEGTIVSASSSDPSETLTTILRRWGYLEEDILEKLQAAASAKRQKLRDVLRQEKLLTEQQINDAVVTLHVERILESFSWRSGTYEFRGQFGADAMSTVPNAQSMPVVQSVAALELPTAPLAEEVGPRPPIDELIVQAATTLNTILTNAGSKTVMLWPIPYRKSIRKFAIDVASLWKEQHLRTLIVDVRKSGHPSLNPIYWKNPKDWRTHAETTTPDGIYLLPVSGEEKSWRTVDGAAQIQQYFSILSTQVDRIIWLTYTPEPGSPLLTISPYIALVLSERRTHRNDLARAVSVAEGAHLQGYFFVREQISNSWANLRRTLRPTFARLTRPA